MEGLIARLDSLRPGSRVRHYEGFPADLAFPASHQEDLPRADVLVIVHDEDGGVFLHRTTDDGRPAGDTWHETVEHAKEQASFEFGDAVGPWLAYRLEDNDPVASAVRMLPRSEE